MLVLLLLSGSLLVSVGSAAVTENWLDNADQLFQDFIRQYEKTYESEEERQHRFNIFKNNLDEAQKMNEGEKENVFGVTKFSDLTLEEFRAMYTGFKKESDLYCDGLSAADIPDVEVPDSFDWRDHNVVTPVKDQKKCGSCYAFSSTGNIEGQYAIKHKQLRSFSEQQIVDCTSASCFGGYPTSVFEWINKVGGLESEDDYTYSGRIQKCAFNASKVAVQVTNCHTYPSVGEDGIKQMLVEQGPISFGIKADTLLSYTGGILTKCAGIINHAVLLVGYGSDSSGSYWIVKNSWGKNFGLDGYFHLGQGDGAGSCGLLEDFNLFGAEVA